ncbi:MAG: hypothetical protein JKY56_14790 [Kofleriaceae bacterium]|nr:hypothetical protein [Kofleriaceae bacterium]
MKSSSGRLPDPFVWFNGAKTEDLSEKISKAFLHQRAAHPMRTDNLLTNIAVEKLGAGVSDSIANDIESELTSSEPDAEDTSASDPLQSDDVIEPDLILAKDSTPISLHSKTPLAGRNKPAGRTKLVGVDLWTIVLGTLVLSIGAQYVLQGFGLAPI